jgi:hypothetical protein
MKAMGLRELEHAIMLLTLTGSWLFEDNECRELTLRLSLGVQEQLIKNRGKKSNGDAER